MPARVLLLLSAFTLLIASDWPEWRGPHRDGVVSEQPITWPERLNLKWKTEVGIGHASPVMAAGSIYSFARQGNEESVLSIDPANGKIRWKQQYAAPYKMNSAAVSHGEGPKSTPVYSDGRLLRTLPGLSGMVGLRGAAQFTASAGSVAVLGLRFDGSVFTSIPTTSPASAVSSTNSSLSRTQ
jgi:hypothetical protein